MAVSKSLVLLLVALAAAVAQSARVARQAPGWAHGAAAHGEDDGSYWPGKYADDLVAPAAPAWPQAAPTWNQAAPTWNQAAPAWNQAAPAWNAAPAASHWGADDGSYYPGKYGIENQA